MGGATESRNGQKKVGEEKSRIFLRPRSQGPEELHLYARIIFRTSYLVNYITSSF